jgi:hypothetical protein
VFFNKRFDAWSALSAPPHAKSAYRCHHSPVALLLDCLVTQR